MLVWESILNGSYTYSDYIKVDRHACSYYYELKEAPVHVLPTTIVV